MGNLTTLVNKVKPALEKETQTQQDRHGRNPQFVKNVTEWNVLLTLERVRQESALLADLEARGEIKIVGGLYCVDSGQVTFFEQ
jgi:carbonic anhydrase